MEDGRLILLYILRGEGRTADVGFRVRGAGQPVPQGASLRGCHAPEGERRVEDIQIAAALLAVVITINQRASKSPGNGLKRTQDGLKMTANDTEEQL